MHAGQRLQSLAPFQKRRLQGEFGPAISTMTTSAWLYLELVHDRAEDQVFQGSFVRPQSLGEGTAGASARRLAIVPLAPIWSN